MTFCIAFSVIKLCRTCVSARGQALLCWLCVHESWNVSTHPVSPALRRGECAIPRAKKCAKASWCAWPRHSGRSERPWGKSSCRVPQHLQLLVAAVPGWNRFLFLFSAHTFPSWKANTPVTQCVCSSLVKPSGSGFMPCFIDLENWEVEGYGKLFVQTSTSN